MDKKELFSVLIANYNNAKYLIRAIDSVRNQTYSNWEIIIVDDKSTDESYEIYKELIKDERIKIFYNQNNKGCGYTKNKCVELSSGDICGFLDPDDELLPGALTDMMEVHQKHQDVGIVYSRCYEMDALGNIIGENQYFKSNKKDSFFLHREIGPMNFSSFKRIKYFETSGISTEIKAGVDHDLYFKMEEVAPFYFLNKFTYKYYIGHNSNAITSGDNKINAFYWNLEVVRATCVRRNLDITKFVKEDFDRFLTAFYRKAYDEGVVKTQNSLSYKIGNFLVKPIKFIKKLIL